MSDLPQRTVQGPVRVLAIIETRFISGPAKNLLAFASGARQAQAGLPALDFTIATYLRGDADPRQDRFIVAAEAAGLPVHVLREQRRFDPAVMGTIRTLVGDLRPHVIQSHNSKSHFLVRLLGIPRQAPWLAFHHGYTATDRKMEAIHALDRWSLRRAARIVTVCGPFRDQLVARGIRPSHIAVHHNAVPPFVQPDGAAMERIRTSLGLPADRPLLVTIGRLSREKGHDDLLRAVARLDRARRPHLVIVGEGPEREPLLAAARRYAVHGDVTLAGHHEDVRPLLAMASLFVLPSHSEGSPNAMLEAMAAGVPVVATRVGGVPELATDDVTARLVPAHDPVAMAAALEELLRDPVLASRLAQTARHASAAWTLEAYRERLTREYVNLLGLSSRLASTGELAT